MARVIYDQSVFVILHCEECGLMGDAYNAAYFRAGGHLVDFQQISNMERAKQAQRIHQKWHDSQSGY